MPSLCALLSLPTSLLLLLASSASGAANSQLEWPYNLPAHVKYFPEDEPLVKRGLAVQEILATRPPIGAKKMSADEDEMFFLEYWQLHPEDEERLAAAYGKQENAEGICDARPEGRIVYHNETLTDGVLPPVLVHTNGSDAGSSSRYSHLFQRSNLDRRQFTCPNGYTSCGGIQRPNSCCANGETCLIVPNTGMGDVGCCPPGASCSGKVQQCNTAGGYQSCPSASGGGCCIPNFSCFGVGCISTTTSTTTTTAKTATVTDCSSSFQSCPASLGGGCCPSAAACGSNGCITSSTSTTTQTMAATTSAPPLAPVRPTGTSSSNDDSAVAPSTRTTGTSLIAVCPTNYYFCSAYYRPGCCRIGRNCAQTNCPAAASSSAVVSNGVTILVPEGQSTGGTSYLSTALITGYQTGFGSGGQCASAWSSCAQSLNGGCCPGGFACESGTLCTADSGTSVVTKLAPSNGGVNAVRVTIASWVFMALASVAGIAMVVL